MPRFTPGSREQSFLIVIPPSLQPTSEGQSLRRKADSPVKTARLDCRHALTGVGRPAVDEFHEEFSTRAVILLRFSVIAELMTRAPRSRAGHTIHAALTFNDAGELADFVSEDRYQASPGWEDETASMVDPSSRLPHVRFCALAIRW
jgi:hypothetical protein